MPTVPASPRSDLASQSGAVSLFMVYQFLKRIVTPFNQWPAYVAGVIDEKGNIVVKAKDRHSLDQKRSFSKFDLLVLKLKRLLEKVPGGSTRFASYAAALYLIKEDWQQHTIEEIETDEYFIKLSEEIIWITEEVREELGGSPTNAIGAGAIAGGGYRGPDDVKVSARARKKYKAQASAQAPRTPRPL